jgi:hypothetical protein
VILIDWSAYHASRFQLLRASLACDGRSLPLMSCVVSSSQTANAKVHERFLESLAECFTPETNVIVITDAGFQGRWFQQVSSRWGEVKKHNMKAIFTFIKVNLKAVNSNVQRKDRPGHR